MLESQGVSMEMHCWLRLKASERNGNELYGIWANDDTIKLQIDAVYCVVYSIEMQHFNGNTKLQFTMLCLIFSFLASNYNNESF
jgi:hypothetical protein